MAKDIKPMKLTKAQIALLKALSSEPDGYAACERICHPNTAAALERRGLLSIEAGDGSFRPWFDCRITPAGLQALTTEPLYLRKAQGSDNV